MELSLPQIRRLVLPLALPAVTYIAGGLLVVGFQRFYRLLLKRLNELKPRLEHPKGSSQLFVSTSPLRVSVSHSPFHPPFLLSRSLALAFCFAYHPFLDLPLSALASLAQQPGQLGSEALDVFLAALDMEDVVSDLLDKLLLISAREPDAANSQAAEDVLAVIGLLASHARGIDVLARQHAAVVMQDIVCTFPPCEAMTQALCTLSALLYFSVEDRSGLSSDVTFRARLCELMEKEDNTYLVRYWATTVAHIVMTNSPMGATDDDVILLLQLVGDASGIADWFRLVLHMLLLACTSSEEHVAHRLSMAATPFVTRKLIASLLEEDRDAVYFSLGLLYEMAIRST